jgi:UDP-N-acetylmuramoylalanine--D-glutamate ligase
MKVAVVGLGNEGKNALRSLLNRGHHVYASDMNKNIELDHFNCADVDLGHHDLQRISSADAVVLSPGLWNTELAKKIRSKTKTLSDVLKNHKYIFTIGVTGTNGKTTTSFMIKEILENAGLNVLIGGNAGGGFKGYTELILKASSERSKYDAMVVEVCDMTLDFCDQTFDFDVVVVTNIGNDHMNFHKSLENYGKSICKFLKGKKAVLNGKDRFLSDMKDCADETFFFSKYNGELNIFGEFNRQNAAAALTAVKIMEIPEKDAEEALKNFKGVEGRTSNFKIHDSNLVIGKTDNADATAAVLNEVNFNVIIIGTPRKGENCRLNTLKEVSKVNPQVVAIFPGLDNTTDLAAEVLVDSGYRGRIQVLKNVEEVVNFTLKCAKQYKNIFIGGNGQKRLIEIENELYKFLNE